MRHFVWIRQICLLAVLLLTGGRIPAGAQQGAAVVPQKPELILQTGHTGPITDLRFSPDGRRLVSTGKRGVDFGFHQVCILWDVRRREQVRTFMEETEALTVGGFSRYAFAPDLSAYAAAGKSAIAVQKTIDGAPLTKLAVPPLPASAGLDLLINDVSLLTFSADAKTLLGAQYDALLVWDPGAKTPRRLAGNGDSITALALSRDGKMAATAVEASDQKNCFINLWNLNTGQEIGRLPGQADEIDCLAFSRDGKRLASAGQDKIVRTWNLETKQEEHAFAGHLKERFVSLVFSADGRFLLSRASASPDEYKLWDLQAAREIKLPQGEIQVATLAPNSALLAVSMDDGLIRLFDLNTMREQERFQGDENALALAFSPDGDTLAAGGFSGNIALWSLAAQRVVARLDTRIDTYSDADFRAGGRLLLMRPFNIGNIGNSMLLSGGKVWDLQQGRCYTLPELILDSAGERIAYETTKWEIAIQSISSGLILQTLQGNNKLHDAGTPILFSPNDKWLLARGIIGYQFYDLTTGKCLSQTVLNFYPNQILIGSDGSYWGALVNGVIHIYEARSGTETRSIPYQQYNVAAPIVTEDGRLAAIVDTSGQAQIVRLDNGHHIATLEGGKRSTARNWQFSPDGTILAENEGENVTFYSTTTGTRQRTQPGTLLCFSGDGRYFALTKEGKIGVYAARTGQAISSLADFNVVDSVIMLKAAFTPDGNRLLVWDADGGAQLYHAQTGAKIATLVSFQGGGSAIITADNYYMTSQETNDALAFRLGDRMVPFDTFDLSRNRPDRVLQALGMAPSALINAYAQAHQKRLLLTGVQNVRPEDAYALPTVETNLPNLPTVNPHATVHVTVRGMDSGVPLTHLDARVNGIPLFGSRGQAIPGGRKTLAREFDVALLPGENQIEVSVYNSRGIESARDEATITYTPSAAPPKPGLYLVAIGVSKYTNSDFNLRYAAKDATDLAAFFQKQTGRYSQIHTLPLTDEKVTREGIARAREFLKPARPEDHVIVFFAGHGLLDERRDYYFATHDIDFKAPAVRGLPYSALEGLLDGVAARWKLLLIDTCHAGEVDPESRGTAALTPSLPAPNGKESRDGVTFRAIRGVVAVSAPAKPNLLDPFLLQRTLFTDLRRATGTVVIAASGGEEAAIESQGNGVFTATIMEALTDDFADLNHDGQVSLEELQTYVAARVSQLTQGRQTPVTRYVTRSALKFPGPPTLRYSYTPTGISRAPTWIGYCSGDRQIVVPFNFLDLLDAETGRLQRTLYAAAISPDGKLYVRDSGTGSLSLRDPDTDAERFQLSLPPGRPESIVFSPDGKRVAVTLKGTLTLWNTATGAVQQIALPGGNESYLVVFSPDGSKIACRLLGNDWTMRDTMTGVELWKYESAWTVFSPDGQTVATQPQSEIILRRATDGTETGRLKSDMQPITLGVLAFLPDGKHLARADNDGVIRFWDLATGRQIASFAGNRSVTQALAFRSDSKRMACGNIDGTLKVWDLDALLHLSRVADRN